MARARDVLIVGGGLIGCATAYYLCEKGVRSVGVLDRGPIGGDASHASAGILSAQSDMAAADALTDLYVEARDLYPDLADELRSRTGIDVELLRWGLLLLVDREEDLEALREHTSWQRGRGLPVEELRGESLRQQEPALSPDFPGGLLFPAEAHLNSRELVRALREAAAQAGADFLEHTPVRRVLTHQGRVTGLETGAGVLSAPNVVVSAGAWSAQLVAPFGLALPVEPCRGQILYLMPESQPLHRVVLTQHGYLAPRLDGGVLVGSTVEFVGFTKAVTLRGLASLAALATRTVPSLADAVVSDSWSGLRPSSKDDLPFIGPLVEPEGLFLAAGHGRKGILLGALTGQMLAEWIATGTTRYATKPFDPGRCSLGSRG